MDNSLVYPFEDSLEWAIDHDLNDPLALYRDRFHFPKQLNKRPFLYFCGNSLGLQPKKAEGSVNSIMQNWRDLAVKGHFEGPEPWITYIENIKPSMARLVGGHSSEIAICNTLTVNLHLLMISFYRPSRKKYRILIERDAFPSDKYAVASQARMHGFDPGDAVIEISPPEGKYRLENEDLKRLLREQGDRIALILLGGVNYFTGQAMDISTITRMAHDAGCMIGWDLAHAAGNIPLQLHDDQVDFAAWCNYKYINSGPGSIASLFIHEKHHEGNFPRLEGWWGNNLRNRFKMEDKFVPEQGAEAWVMSTPPSLAIAPIKASLDIFNSASMPLLRQKSRKLTSYLEYLIGEIEDSRISIITPRDPENRGCQLSIQVESANKDLFYQLLDRGIIVDWREPDVIRVAPVPLYNSFEDVYRFADILKNLLKR